MGTKSIYDYVLSKKDSEQKLGPSPSKYSILNTSRSKLDSRTGKTIVKPGINVLAEISETCIDIINRNVTVISYYPIVDLFGKPMKTIKIDNHGITAIEDIKKYLLRNKLPVCKDATNDENMFWAGQTKLQDTWNNFYDPASKTTTFSQPNTPDRPLELAILKTKPNKGCRGLGLGSTMFAEAENMAKARQYNGLFGRACPYFSPVYKQLSPEELRKVEDFEQTHGVKFDKYIKSLFMFYEKLNCVLYIDPDLDNDMPFNFRTTGQTEKALSDDEMIYYSFNNNELSEDNILIK